MDLDILLSHYFGSADAIEPMQLAEGTEKLRIDFGVERDPGRRFALWALMEALGIAPPPAEAFKDADEDGKLRRAAEEYLTAAWRLERD